VVLQKLLLTFPPISSTIFNVMNKEQLAQIAQIFLNILEKQSFKNWYEREFEDYIVGEGGAPSKQQLLNELERQILRELR